MNNRLGFAGALILAQSGVINQWRADDKYSIAQMDYGLSIKNHVDGSYPQQDIKAIVRHCLPGTGAYETKIGTDGICRVYVENSVGCPEMAS